MIEDLEGASSEPPRRLHVVALSAASAAISLILLLAFVLPPSDVGRPALASPAAVGGEVRFGSPSASPFTVILARPDTRLTVSQVFSRDGTALVTCFVGSDASGSPLVFARPDTWAPSVPVGPEPSTARSVPVPVAAPQGWLTVSCATSDEFAPREMIAR